MAEHLLSIQFSFDDLAAIDGAIQTIESRTQGLIGFSPGQRKKLFKMGGKSEAFCRQALNYLAQNPEIVPTSVDVADANGDLLAIDQLRPRLARLLRLVERMQDSETALGCDVIKVALQGYALIKLAGKARGLTALHRSLGARFKGQGRRPDSDPDDAGTGGAQAE